MFTASDNKKFMTPPTEEKVKQVVKDSNLYAAPGTDGIPSLLYKECWNVLGSPLTEVMQDIGKGLQLQRSMRTSLMVFSSKPKKPNSITPGEKYPSSTLTLRLPSDLMPGWDNIFNFMST